MISVSKLDGLRPLQNAPFCPISVSPMSGIYQQAQIFILKILNVWMPVPINYLSGWLKFSPALNLNKIEHFSKVSETFEKRRLLPNPVNE